VSRRKSAVRHTFWRMSILIHLRRIEVLITSIAKSTKLQEFHTGNKRMRIVTDFQKISTKFINFELITGVWVSYG
jgi:hypothetical protein